MQHVLALSSGSNPNCPCIQFNLDLCSEVTKWTQEGDLIILDIDYNEDVTDNKHLSFHTSMKTVGLHEAIISSHQTKHPSKYNRGQRPIDSIFVSAILTPTKSGFTRFLEPLNNHRSPWIYFTWEQVLGHPPLMIPQSSIQCLQCDNPITVKKYNDCLHQYCKKLHIEEQLQNISSYTPNHPNLHREYNRLDQLRTLGMLKAEKNCRKIHIGRVPFTLEVSEAALCI